jgi:hypothetical protein
MQIITDKDELKSLVKSLRNILRDKSLYVEEIETRIGHRGESYEYKVYYSKTLDIWFAFGELTTRYWNAFGIGRPGRSTRIVTEINIPVEGKNRRIGGVFVKDNRGVWLGHRGTIGGGSRGVGYKAFWKHYKGEVVHVPDDGELVPIAYIDYINSPNLPEKVKRFVLEVNRIKELCKAVNP